MNEVDTLALSAAVGEITPGASVQKATPAASKQDVYAGECCHLDGMATFLSHDPLACEWTVVKLKCFFRQLHDTDVVRPNIASGMIFFGKLCTVAGVYLVSKSSSLWAEFSLHKKFLVKS